MISRDFSSVDIDVWRYRDTSHNFQPLMISNIYLSVKKMYNSGTRIQYGKVNRTRTM